ncbi:hypothetical protein D3C78_1383520 [compost metagenome]
MADAARVLERAKAGDAAAQAQIGIWSLYGRGTLIPLDEKAAFQWQERAAAQRHLVGVDYMSAFYENGNTAVKRDAVESLKWAYVLKTLQQEEGKPTAQTDARLKRLEAGLTPVQIREAKGRAAVWLKAHPAPKR